MRRTHLAFESADQALAIAPAVAALVAPILSWTIADSDAALKRYADEVRAIFTVRDA
ncbi:hypothetical protein D3C83_212600 [compost metagenome]